MSRRLTTGVRRRCRVMRRRGPLAGLRVLVVDDEALVRDATRLLLESEGATVSEARDGAEALATLRRRRVDIVLCDLRMPRLDGPGFLGRLRRDARWTGTPVVAVTAHLDRYPDEIGFDAYLGKPFAPTDLTALLVRFRKRRTA